MATLTIVVGLPGSGKSHFLQSLGGRLGHVCSEDYMAKAIDHSPEFCKSKHYADLVGRLTRGEDCVIADITFCRNERREEFRALLQRVVPGVEIRWLFFERDVEQCVRNVWRRSRAVARREEQEARRLAVGYFPPTGAAMLPVWRPGATS